MKTRTVGKVSFDGTPLSIGRSSSNHIVLPSRMVSRKHAVIEVIDGQPHIRDLGSSFGTHVNEQRVISAPLFDDDTIRIGRFELAFSNPGQPKRPQTPAPLIETLAVDLDSLATACEDRENTKPVATKDDPTAESLLASLKAELENRTAELDSRLRELAMLESSLQEQQGALVLERISLASQQEALVREQESACHAQEQLQAARDTAERRCDLLQSQVDSLTADLATARGLNESLAEARDEANRATQQARSEVEELQRLRTADMERIEMMIAAARNASSSIESLQEELIAVRAEREAFNQRVAALESSLEARRQDADRAQRELARKNRELLQKVAELERISDAAETMEHQLHETQVMQAIAHERSNVVVRALQQYESGSQNLQQASMRLSKILRVIEAIEAQWVECDERMADSESLDPSDVEAAIAERDHLAVQLEDAHTTRDLAVANLLALTEQISSMGVSVPEAQGLQMPTPAKSWRSRSPRKRWWLFGR